MKEVLTFILPTRNRKQYVRRAVDSCLQCESDTVSPFVIVIDGESDDGTFTDLQNAYRDDTRVLLLQNSKSAGFMNTCYEGVDLVKSKWVTFMYDDDVLSPYFIKMVSELIRSDDRFVMGYGAAFPAGEIYPFKPIDTFKRYRPEQLLLAYYGRNSELDFKGLPHSPICCVTTLDLLHEWVPYVKDFCSRNSIRSYFMLKRNIGPDLMIYLLSLLKHEGNISLCVSVVAQFSAHPTSMSVTYGNSDLAVGYWLAKIWGFEYLCRAGRRHEAAVCASALVFVGSKTLAARLIRFQTKWAGMILREIAGILFTSIRDQIVLRTLRESYVNIFEWIRTRSREVLPKP